MVKTLLKKNQIAVDVLNRKDDDDNKESATLIWFDPNIESRENTENKQQKLRLINDFVIFTTDLDHCVTLIQSINKENIFLINIREKRYAHLLNEYSKIIGVYVELDDLCQSIKEQIQTFSFFYQHEKLTEDLSKESASFLWFQLFNYVIIRLSRNQQAKQRMIQLCKDYYRGNKRRDEINRRIRRKLST
ncbi:unnamed protein product [Rotaria magnacalcarata]|uniref:Uncharacterized protein n=1 Tax=Rotaria magnacalcarata TaxID=392030 RepID=A0A816WJ76_9BILA|nr:unnamed protein product [Rotaria magnacalcarata]